MANALKRRASLLVIIHNIVEFDQLKELYPNDENFSEV